MENFKLCLCFKKYVIYSVKCANKAKIRTVEASKNLSSRNHVNQS